jgi:methylmalonyl-CoA/ethylmalonyl-CoA epimerase
MESAITKLLQIGIIVEDLDATVKHYEEEYGIGPWHVGQLDTEKFPKLEVDGKPTDLVFRMAMCHCFGLEIELIQPVSDSAYMEWLKEHGPGIHHIAVITKDPFKDVVAEHKRLTGKDPWIHAKDTGAPEGRNLEFAYLDLRKELGLFLEIYPEHVEKHHEGNIGGHAYKETKE